jgi:glutamate-1-semialdehyde 2,1-aminomutase
VIAAHANGARLTDTDGHEYVDLCLGDTGAMTGHAPGPVVEAASRRIATGTTMMLPTEDAEIVAGELATRFGVPRWLFTLSATDANRAALRIARHATGRDRIVCFSYSYHGSVDETFAVQAEDGSTRSREGNVGAPVVVQQTTRAIEFNDVEGLRNALAPGDVALVIAEPAMTNMGIVLPEPGYHDELRRLTREAGTLLLIDETHTFSAGPGGCTRAWGLEPDLLTIGKAIGGGVPAGAWGISDAIADRILDDAKLRQALVEGIGVGGTLAGNVLSARAISLTLANLLTRDDFTHMSELARQWREGVERHISDLGLPWHVTQLGARAEYHFYGSRPRNGSQLAAAGDERLERFLRLYLTNRGILTTPFHNMALMAPTTTVEDVARHEEILGEALQLLVN